MKHLSLLALMLLSTAAAQGAPTATFPDGFLSAEGNGLFGHPWYWTNARTLTLLDGNSLPVSPRTVGWLSIRPDGTVSSMAPKTLTVEVAMSNQGVVASVPPFSTDWSKHYGTDRRVVMKRRTVNLPSAAKPSTAPHSWANAFTLPFDAPWQRTGSAADAVCIDCKTWTPQTASSLWYADAAAFDRFGSFTVVGTGCPTTATYHVGGHYEGSTNGLYTFGYSRGVGDSCVAWMGIDQIALPFGNYRTAPCTLYVAPLLVHPKVIQTTSTTGYASSWTWLAAVTPSFVGATFLSQMGAVDRNGAIKLTHAVRVRIGRGINGSERQGTIYNIAGSTTPFDPDTSPAAYLSNQVMIVGIR